MSIITIFGILVGLLGFYTLKLAYTRPKLTKTYGALNCFHVTNVEYNTEDHSLVIQDDFASPEVTSIDKIVDLYNEGLYVFAIKKLPTYISFWFFQDVTLLKKTDNTFLNNTNLTAIKQSPLTPEIYFVVAKNIKETR